MKNGVGPETSTRIGERAAASMAKMSLFRKATGDIFTNIWPWQQQQCDSRGSATLPQQETFTDCSLHAEHYMKLPVSLNNY